ncbi:hypothetical protein ACFTXM_44345 [Streptomyces sp. NPDC056930]|uniref:hypothetical protein n=1 Tax=Streptomyces sp. NPDC056930 TaxID=3345967 RepID=UPI003637520E
MSIQAQDADPVEDLPDSPDHVDPVVGAEHAGLGEEGHPGAEVVNVGAAEKPRLMSAVLTLQPQGLREPFHAPDRVLQRGCDVPAPAPRQLVVGPDLDRFPEGPLMDPGEVESATVPEDDQVPDVLEAFGLRSRPQAAQGRPGAPDDHSQVVDETHAVQVRVVELFETRDLQQAYSVADRAEPVVAGLHFARGADLEAVEELGDEPVGQAAQADLPVHGHRGRRAAPCVLVTVEGSALALDAEP